MREAIGDLFRYPAQAIVIPTNGMLTSGGSAVMGAGVALAAAKRWYWLPAALGARIREHGLMVEFFGIEPDQEVVAFPTKRDWRDPSDLGLIETSALELAITAAQFDWDSVVLPHVGCGLGGLDWETQVRPILARHLDDRFTAVAPPAPDREDGS